MKSHPPIVSLLPALACAMCWADEGKIPLYQPSTISQAGHYILTRDLTLTSSFGSTAIFMVSANNVTIDYGGHTTTLVGAFARHVEIAPGFTNVTVRNGRMVGGVNGVYYFDTTTPVRARIEDLHIEGPTDKAVILSYGGDVTVARCRIDMPGQFGIYVQASTPFTVTGRFVENEIRDVPTAAGQVAIYLQTVKSAEIRGNKIKVAAYGIRVFGQVGGANIIADNVVEGTTEIGIYLNDNNSIVERNALSGDYLQITGSGNRVAGNVVNSGDQWGIILGGSYNHLFQNIVRESTAYGVYVSGAYNFIEGNHITDHPTYGLVITGGETNRYRDNYLLGNGTACGCTAPMDAGGNITN